MRPATSSRASAGSRISRPILFGSHIDSVPNGGNFDGDLGTFSALEVIQAVQAAKIQTRHPLEMVLWAHEESTAFGIGTAASRIVAGDLQARRHGRGVERHETRRRDPAHRRRSRTRSRRPCAARARGTAYVELHIEQGGTLDQAEGARSASSKASSASTATTSSSRASPTTPARRRWASGRTRCVAASQLTLAVRDIATSRPGPPGRHGRPHRGGARTRRT